LIIIDLETEYFSKISPDIVCHAILHIIAYLLLIDELSIKIDVEIILVDVYLILEGRTGLDGEDVDDGRSAED